MEEEVSSFMENSFGLKPPANETRDPLWGLFSDVYCGSKSEFYIIPALPCINDDDRLECKPCMLAFSGFVPILQDDVEYCEEKISCYRIESYENYPSFVRLQIVGDMIYNWYSRKYEFSKSTSTIKYVSVKDIYGPVVCVGLRIELTHNGPDTKYITTTGVYDHVICICSPEWPLEAEEWATRQRNGKWPTEANIRKVVQNGCHVVCAQHQNCRADLLQFRLSFSLAEVILLRSWTSKQQLVFHMLRFFAKRELIDAECPKEKNLLCTYHLKTLMLWTCEQESVEFWMMSSDIEICCKLLRKLLEWIEKRHFPNYFIPKANIFREKCDRMTTECTTNKLNLFCDSVKLSQWFVNNYLLVCYRNLITGRVPNELGEFRITKLHRAILSRKKQCQLISLDTRFYVTTSAYTKMFWRLNEIVISNKTKVYTQIRDKQLLVTKFYFLKYEKLFINLDLAMIMLFATNALICQAMLADIDFVSDILSVVSLEKVASTDWKKYHNFPKRCYRERLMRSHVCFLIAQEHMGKLRRPGNDPEFQLMSRLSMHYLRKSYYCQDSSTVAIRSATVVYMAAICFATAQFQAVIDLCSSIVENEQPPVAINETPHRREEHLNAGSLLFIDDMSNCVGFILLVQYMHIHIINKLRFQYRPFAVDLRLTPHVFANYLMIQSAERMSNQLRVNWCDVPNRFLMDFLLIGSVKRRFLNTSHRPSTMCVYRRNHELKRVLNLVTDFYLDEDICIQLLMECSLNSLDLFYQNIFDYYGVHCGTVVNCYRAFYCFKLSQFNRVLSLCDQILDDPELEDYLHNISRPQTDFANNSLSCLAFPNVLALPPFNAYFDKDLHCLIGLQALWHVSFPKHSSPTFDGNSERLCEHSDMRAMCYGKFPFYILLEQTGFALQYFMGRHFVARYLKLQYFWLRNKRCVLEIFDPIRELIPKLPFEHIVCQYLQGKLKRSFPGGRGIV